MAFIRHPNPHHIQHSEHGWLSHDHLEQLPDTAGRINREVFVGGPAEVEHPHWVEVDVATQLVGYTRLTDVELEAQQKESRAYAKAQGELQAARQAEDDLISAAATKDPVIALIAKRLGLISGK